MGVLFLMAFIHVSVILSGILADMPYMGQQSKIRAARNARRKGYADPDAMPYLLPTASAEMMRELLEATGIEGDLAGRQFIVQVQEEQRTVAFDEEGRMITGESNASRSPWLVPA